MLQRLRDKSQGWITWLIMGLIVLTFVMWGAESAFDFSGRNGETVAKVNGRKITSREIDTLYQQLIKQPGQEAVRGLDPAFVKKELLQSLIDQVILLQTTQKMGMDISTMRINNTIANVPVFKDENGQFSQAAYSHFLGNANYTDTEFRKLVRDNLLREQLQQGVMQTAFSLPADLENLARTILQKRSFRFTTVEKKPFEANVTITDDEIKQYYDKHTKDFSTPEQVALDYVQLSLPELSNSHQPTESELKNFYQENIALYSEPERIHVAHILVALPDKPDDKTLNDAKVKIESIQQKLKNGESFDKLAKEYSDDKASAEKGGDLEWLQKGELAPEFEKGAFALQKSGDISNPVKTEFGYHLIKLIGIKRESAHPFEAVKEQVAKQLKQDWAQEQFVNKSEELGALAYDHPDSLQSISDKLGLPIKKTELFTKDKGPAIPLLENTTVITTAFNPRVKDDKNNSDVIKLDAENVIVLRVAKQVPSQVKPLETVKDEIRGILLNEKSENLAKNKSQEILNSLEKAPESDLAKVSAGITWKDIANHARNQKDVTAEMSEAVFSMPALDNNKKIRPFKQVRLNNGDYAIIWLTQIENGDINKATAQEKEAFLNSLNKHWGELEFALYVTDLFKKAKIKK